MTAPPDGAVKKPRVARRPHPIASALPITFRLSSIMPRAILLGCVLLGCVGADIVVSRTVDALTIGKLNLTVAPGCTAHDEYGSSACALNWGSTYTVYASGALTQDIVAGSTITIDAKLDGFVPLHLTCPACGANCSVTIPIVKKHLHWTMPDCPISSGKLPFTKTYTLPSSSPVPLKSKRSS